METASLSGKKMERMERSYMPPPASLANLRPIQKGETRNPGGKTVHARNRVTAKFLNALADDFDLHGDDAIIKLREHHVDKYISIIASLLPKDINIDVGGGLSDLLDPDDLTAIAALIRNPQMMDALKAMSAAPVIEQAPASEVNTPVDQHVTDLDAS